MAAQATDTSSLEEEIYYTYYSFTECGSDFEYEGKVGYTCEPEYSKEDLGTLGKEVREEADDIGSDDSDDTRQVGKLALVHMLPLLYHAKLARVEML